MFSVHACCQRLPALPLPLPPRLWKPDGTHRHDLRIKLDNWICPLDVIFNASTGELWFEWIGPSIISSRIAAHLIFILLLVLTNPMIKFCNFLAPSLHLFFHLVDVQLLSSQLLSFYLPALTSHCKPIEVSYLCFCLLVSHYQAIISHHYWQANVDSFVDECSRRGKSILLITFLFCSSLQT